MTEDILHALFAEMDMNFEVLGWSVDDQFDTLLMKTIEEIDSLEV